MRWRKWLIYVRMKGGQWEIKEFPSVSSARDIEPWASPAQTKAVEYKVFAYVPRPEAGKVSYLVGKSYEKNSPRPIPRPTALPPPPPTTAHRKIG